MQASIRTRALDGKKSLNPYFYGESYRINCPFCRDTRHRLYINHRWGLKDPDTQSLNLWLAKCFNENCLSHYSNQRQLYNDVFSDVSDGRDELLPGDPALSRSREFVWPGEMRLLTDFDDCYPAVAYLRDRGFDPEQLSRDLGITVCIYPEDEFHLAFRRIIIPVCMNGIRMGWQARYAGTPPSGVPKYYSMPGWKKSQCLYNYDTARKWPYVIICEGCTDVWRVGPTGVALFGKDLSPVQRQLIATTWANGTAIVMLDADAGDSARKIYQDLAGLVRNRVLIRLPDGADPGSMGTRDLHQLVHRAAKEQGIELPILGAPSNRPMESTIDPIAMPAAA